MTTGNVTGDSTADIVVGAGARGESRVAIFDGESVRRGTVLAHAADFVFRAYTDPADNTRAPLKIRLKDHDLDSIIDELFVGQGADGKSESVRVFEPLSDQLVEELFGDAANLDEGEHDGWNIG